MYLFVAFPNNSGSTLMAQLLATSPNVSCLKDRPTLEGHDVCREYMPHPGKLKDQPVRTFTEERFYFRRVDEYDWEGIKKCWHEAWDMTKPIQMEKTPTNVVKAEIMAENLQPSKFVLGIRDLKSFIKSLEKFNVQTYEAALHWGRCAFAQVRNLKNIGPKRTIMVRYEDLCDEPEQTCKRLINLVPELETLDWKSLDIKNANKGEELSEWDRSIMRSALKGNEELVHRFEYGLH